MTESSQNLRNISLSIIEDVTSEDRFVNVALKDYLDRQKLKSNEKAFITRLVNGTIEQKIYLDYVISKFNNKPNSKLRPVVLSILRMSIYQILFMDSVPDSAACNEAVKLIRKRGLGSLSGFVNAVLRNVSRNKEAIELPDRNSSELEYFSVKYSMPEWIVKHLIDFCSADTAENIFKWYLENNELTVRCNTSKKSAEDIKAMLSEDNAEFEENAYFKEALSINNAGNIAELRAFKEGYIQVQDVASMLPGFIIPVNEGDSIIDVCAAPGGKSLHAADRLNGTGSVKAFDLTADKVSKINENIKRTGFKNITAEVHDALIYSEELKNSADIVIADLPCSGLGIIGKKPDIKYNISRESVLELSKLQRDILSVVHRYVKPGGYLLYSTCTITKEENLENFDWIKSALKFEPVSIKTSLPEAFDKGTLEEGYIQLLPGEFGTDGFFVSLLRRNNE